MLFFIYKVFNEKASVWQVAQNRHKQRGRDKYSQGFTLQRSHLSIGNSVK